MRKYCTWPIVTVTAEGFRETKENRKVKYQEGADQTMKRRHQLGRSIRRLLILILLIAVSVGAFYGFRGYRMYRGAIEQMSVEERVEQIRAREHFTRYSELTDFYIDAVISVEDHRFKEHMGLDLIAICRAVWIDLKTMSFREGGSTITQQLAKNMLFTQEKTIERKAAEVFAVLDIEAEYSKEEIFELYVNTASFGEGYYGIYDASKGYFEKEPLELTDYESAVMAGVPNAPSVYAPGADRELAAQRTAQVLRSMVRNNVITQAQMDGML